MGQRDHGLLARRARDARRHLARARRAAGPADAARAAAARRRADRRPGHRARRGLRPAAVPGGARLALVRPAVGGRAVRAPGQRVLVYTRAETGRRRTSPRSWRSCPSDGAAARCSPTCARAGSSGCCARAGRRCNRALLDAGLLDELFLTLSPVVTGDEASRRSSTAAAAERARSTLRSVATADGGSVPALQRVGSARHADRGSQRARGRRRVRARRGDRAAAARRRARTSPSPTSTPRRARRWPRSSARASSSCDVTEPEQVEAAVDAAGASADLRLLRRRRLGREGRRQARPAPVRAVPHHGHGQPDRHLQRAAPRGGGDARQRARRRRRVRRDRQHRLDRRLRRPDRPDRLRGLEGRRSSG